MILQSVNIVHMLCNEDDTATYLVWNSYLSSFSAGSVHDKLVCNDTDMLAICHNND